jgi:NAD(P)-dependent dehydrogenase (short-subunit alcohol dehydrogenase family)
VETGLRGKRVLVTGGSGGIGAACARALAAEPAEADVHWLAAHGTAGDLDHARWELRYARRALGLIAAQRDALDDRTASAVAHALAAELARDPRVDAAKRHVAERQFNARLRAFADVLANRDSGGVRQAMGGMLLAFAGSPGRDPDAAARAGELMMRYLTEGNARLREAFGAAELPENVAPSASATRTAR